jgi:hypothetical protein
LWLNTGGSPGCVDRDEFHFPFGAYLSVEGT